MDTRIQRGRAISWGDCARIASILAITSFISIRIKTDLAISVKAVRVPLPASLAVLPC